jgi:hypothetical protein
MLDRNKHFGSLGLFICVEEIVYINDLMCHYFKTFFFITEDAERWGRFWPYSKI